MLLPSPGGWVAQWPSAWLGGLGTPWNTLQLGGSVRLVSPGANLVDAKKKHKVLVRADGAVSLGATVGSIHRMGALAQGLDACNGWTFWHLVTPKGLVCIDTFRAGIRAEMATV